MIETAYAKINLALHVRGVREDSYREIETLFAFVDQGDRLSSRGGPRDEVRVSGEFASQLTDPFGNIVAKALAVLPRRDGLRIDLEKNLPVAAGLGGGSADAGAVFRLVRAAHGLPDDWRERAARLGADVTACVESAACIGRGTGAKIEPVENDLAGRAVLLVNPRVPLPTGPVFDAWDGVDRGGLADGPASVIAREGRNDLEAPAISLCPPPTVRPVASRPACRCAGSRWCGSRFAAGSAGPCAIAARTPPPASMRDGCGWNHHRSRCR